MIQLAHPCLLWSENMISACGWKSWFASVNWFEVLIKKVFNRIWGASKKKRKEKKKLLTLEPPRSEFISQRHLLRRTSAQNSRENTFIYLFFEWMYEAYVSYRMFHNKPYVSAFISSVVTIFLQWTAYVHWMNA